MKPFGVAAIHSIACLALVLAGCDLVTLIPGTTDGAAPAGAAAEGDAVVASRLIGAWIASDAAEPVGGEIGRRMSQGFDENALRLEFLPGGKLAIYRDNQPTPTGAWQITRSNGRQLHVRLSAPGLCPDGASADFLISLADDNHLTLRRADADGLSFNLTRQSPRVASR
jgi:hypothetical protein